MAGGSLTITVATYAQLQAVASSVLCLIAAGNRGLVRTDSSVGGNLAIVIPEEIFPANILLKRLGTDLIAGYVAGTHIFHNAANGAAIETDPNVCAARTNQPTVSTIATNVGGNPRAITVNYANAVGAGTVNIYWGDGTSTLGAAESGASSHTYAPTTAPFGTRIRIEDASAPAEFADFVVRVP